MKKPRIFREAEWTKKWGAWIFLSQVEWSDCGPSALLMICRYYKIHVGRRKLYRQFNDGKFMRGKGMSVMDLNRVAQLNGFRTLVIQSTFAGLKKLPCPFILHWEENHFVVVYSTGPKRVIIADPAKGFRSLSYPKLKTGACRNGRSVVLLLEPARDGRISA